jgi:hypothetical protein
MPLALALKKAGTALLILAISLALGEIVLRIVHRISPSYVFHDDSYNRFRVKPGSDYYGFPINPLGFLDTDFSKADGSSFRIVALGDSFAFGVVPYQDNYLTLLEADLGQAGLRAEVFNMGIPRTAPADYLNLLVNEGLALEPDLVLVNFYIGNDLIETHRSLHWNRPLHERSHVISLLRFALRLHNRAEGGVFHDRQVYSDDAPTFSRASYIEIIGDRAKVYLVGWDGMAASVDAVMDAIERMRVICRRRGIPMAVVLIPEETQLDPELQAALPHTYRIYREGTMDYLQPNRILSERLGEAGIPFLDLYPAFAAAAPAQRLYKPFDSHWNIAGNRLAAEQIAGFLVERGLVAESDRR